MMFNSFGHPFYKCENITETIAVKHFVHEINGEKGKKERGRDSIWSVLNIFTMALPICLCLAMELY